MVNEHARVRTNDLAALLGVGITEGNVGTPWVERLRGVLRVALQGQAGHHVHRHVVYCHGCGACWVDPGAVCFCAEGDEHYETWESFCLVTEANPHYRMADFYEGDVPMTIDNPHQPDEHSRCVVDGHVWPCEASRK